MASRAVLVGELEGATSGQLFRADLEEVVLTRLTDAGDRLLIEVGGSGLPLRRIEGDPADPRRWRLPSVSRCGVRALAMSAASDERCVADNDQHPDEQSGNRREPAGVDDTVKVVIDEPAVVGGVASLLTEVLLQLCQRAGDADGNDRPGPSDNGEM